MPTALALSPHLDDAAFSCGGMLATLSRVGWRVVVATIFTASVPHPHGFALACQLDKGLAADVDYMALRRNEDFLAARALGAEPVWLPFAEAPHRGYASAEALFTDVREDDAIAADLRPALAVLIGDLRPDLLLAPQAIGRHVDHVEVVRALIELAPASSVLWWRDFPYAVRNASPEEPFGDMMALLPQDTIALSPPAQDAKLAACRSYRSQLGFQFGGEKELRRKLAEAGPVESFRRSGTRATASHFPKVGSPA